MSTNLPDAEWTAIYGETTQEMIRYVKKCTIPIHINNGDHGIHWGTGSLIDVDGCVHVLSNKHVIEKLGAEKLSYIAFDSEDVFSVHRPDGERSCDPRNATCNTASRKARSTC